MFETLVNVNNIINDFVWVKIGLVLLIGTGILMTCLTKFFQIGHFRHWMKNTIGSVTDKNISGHTKDKGSISQFQALCTALAATIGVGNIAGVAGAIVTGGPGAVFWMWLAAFFGMMTNYSENVLGIYFRRRNFSGEWSGGAMYYLSDGLGSYKGCKKIGKVLAVLFAIFTVLASFGIGNMGQVNKIVLNIQEAFPVKSLNSIGLYSGITLYNVVIGGALLALAALIIIGGLKRIANFAEKVIPLMVVLFVLGSLFIIGVNYTHIGKAFASIFTRAFNTKAVWGGATGVALKVIVTQGFKRGVFSNEAGLGSSVMVHSNSNVKEPVKQGLWGIFEVFADTMVVCTMTALVILTSGVIDLETGVLAEGLSGDATLVSAAFGTVFGTFGSKFVAVCIFLFAFTTVLGWSHYGSKAIEYLGGEKAVPIYKVIFTLMIMSGALMTSSIAWDISDTFNGLMMIPNLIGVVALSGTVVKITDNYVDRVIKKKDVKPVLSFFDDIQAANEKELANTK
ncbi:MAG: alanine/glycine:cation symporter family protein [Clostridia bacterium]|nr:alanine/glycine:cation symporter family protein [Clostridia bacterium]